VIDELIQYMAVTETKVMMYSGLVYEERNDEQLRRDVDMLNRSAQLLARNGARLLYHNHHWEFADDARIMNYLLDNAAPEFGLCPDVGWLMKGGMDVITFLERVRDRIGAVHFKDFATDRNDVVDTVELGTGVAPLDVAADWVRRNFQGLWLVAEQDDAVIPPAEAARQNIEYIRSRFQ